MSNYEPTREQEKAIRAYLHESIVPLIEQVLVKKLGQAMCYAAQELVNPKREWRNLGADDFNDFNPLFKAEEAARWAEAKLKEKNT